MNKDLVDKINNIYWKYDIKPQVVSKEQDLAVLTSISCFGYKNNRGPIGVSKCLFNDKEEVTLVTLGGTEIKEGQATRFLESKLSMKGKDNDYLKALIKLFDDGVIPKDKPVILSGISLGGMIAQQLLSVDRIINNYNIKSIITFGSPLTKPVDRKGIRIVRFTEKCDIVPKLGSLYYINPKLRKELNNKEVILEDGKYKIKVEAHTLSYVSNSNWDKYDFYGEESGTNKLEILEEIKFYDAPIIIKEVFENPILETERLILRKVTLDDLDDMYDIWSDESMSVHMLWKTLKSKEEALERLKRVIVYETYNFAYVVEEKESHHVIGFAGIRQVDKNTYSEAGIAVATKAQRKGYGREIVKALEYLTFDVLKGKRLLYTSFDINENSMGLAKKCGYKYLKEEKYIREHDQKEFNKVFFYKDKKMYKKSVR